MSEKHRVQGRWGTGLLTFLLAFGLLLAACSSDTGGGQGNSGGSVSGGETANTNGGGGSGSDAGEELEPVKLVWYLRQSKPNNADAVLEKFNQMVYDEIRATVEFQFINPGDYDDKMTLVMSSGEVYDLAYTASWTNNYFNNVSRGAYLPLDEYIDKFPDLKNLFKPEIWDAVRINGKIYGVPNMQIMADQKGFWFKKDLVEKYNLDVTNIDSWEKMAEVLQVIKDHEPNIIPLRQGYPGQFREYGPSVEGFLIDPETLKVVIDHDYMLQEYIIMRDFYERGFFPPDVATMTNEAALIGEGKIFSRYNRYKPGTEAELQNAHGYEFIAIPTGPAVINQGAITSTLTAVSATSKNPERAVMLLDLLNKNKEIYNTLIFGLEGQDYTKVGENRIERIEGGYQIANWMVGNVFNSYLLPGQDDDVWEQTKALNDSAILDPLMGFSFDRTAVESEIARLNAVSMEFTPILSNGLDDPETTYREYIEKRKASGEDAVIAEIERQLAEWKANQGE